jgi:serine/threonine-protein kinase HipA
VTWAEVRLWGRTIGAVSLAEGSTVAAFEYAPAFIGSGIEVAPLAMPLARRVYSFPSLPSASFRGLPGLLADSLPDRFGHAVIDAWLAARGLAPDSFNAIERLCYVGTRGMGALEYAPAAGPRTRRATRLAVDALVELASDIMSRRADLHTSFDESARTAAIKDILRIGTSAGGARAKAIIAWNPATNEVRSGQMAAGPGFEYWLLKLDGVRGNRDRELDDPQGYGAIEFAYSLMAREAGITMTACRMLEEGGRRHFMTRRFDRPAGGGKLHMQSLGALAHLDYNAAGAHSYEGAFLVVRRLDLPPEAAEELFRRMLFNIVTRNQDDHVKNIAFVMDRAGRWSLAPAYDVVYACNPGGAWTASHQMSVNGKRDGFTLEDLRMCGRAALLPRGRADAILEQVRDAARQWPACADAATVAPDRRDAIGRQFRMAF